MQEAEQLANYMRDEGLNSALSRFCLYVCAKDTCSAWPRMNVNVQLSSEGPFGVK